MLATLNLQLFPVEMLDDSVTSPASLLPEANGELESGFADLLRLRVDASLSTDQVGGELLPQGGSGLPNPGQASGLNTANGATSLPDMETVVPAQDALTPPVEQADIALETPVIYPPLNESQANATISTVLPRPGGQSGGHDATPGVVGRRDKVLTDAVEMTRLPADMRRATEAERPAVRDIAPPVLERSAEMSPGIGLPLRAQSGLAQRTAPAPVSLASEGIPKIEADLAARAGRVTLPGPALQPVQTPDAAEILSPVDLPKRPDAAPLHRADGTGEALTELIRPRGTVPQPVQVLQAQFSAQPSQAMFASAPGVSGVADASYAAAAQQATDLIGTPVRDTAWGEQIGQRVLLMTANQLQTAEIRLTPAEMGPLRVQVSLEDGATNVSFHAQHAVTREAIEQALPRLREMLAENGLSLGQADVGEQGVAEGNRDRDADGQLPESPAEDAQEVGGDDDHRRTTTVMTANGLVDTFA